MEEMSIEDYNREQKNCLKQILNYEIKKKSKIFRTYPKIKILFI